MKEGEEYDITIEAVGAKGDGIGKINNFVVFVAGGQVGEKLRVRIDRVLNKFAIAQSVGSASGGSAPAQQSESAPESESMEAESGDDETEGQ